MLLIIVMATVVAIGLTAIALAEPHRPRREVVVWNDETECRLLYDRKLHAGWW
jgi:hypothetical protein